MFTRFEVFDHSLSLVFPKVFRLKAKTTRKGGPVDQPGMSTAETPATRLNRPLGMLQAPALRKEQETRKVAGSNPARSTNFKPCFSRFFAGFCPNESDLGQAEQKIKSRFPDLQPAPSTVPTSATQTSQDRKMPLMI